MRSKSLACIGVMACSALVLSGCAIRALDFTVISSKNIHLNVPDSGKGPRTRGEDTKLYILFPLGSPNMKDALDRAIEKAGPGYDALVDGVVRYKAAFLFGKFGWIVEGTPIKSAEFKRASTTPDGQPQLALDNVLYHSSAGIPNDETLERLALGR
jgi:hypothetical protein